MAPCCSSLLLLLLLIWQIDDNKKKKNQPRPTSYTGVRDKRRREGREVKDTGKEENETSRRDKGGFFGFSGDQRHSQP